MEVMNVENLALFWYFEVTMDLLGPCTHPHVPLPILPPVPTHCKLTFGRDLNIFLRNLRLTFPN